jgi:DNA-binding HxlR family transcriptional regulator
LRSTAIDQPIIASNLGRRLRYYIPINPSPIERRSAVTEDQDDSFNASRAEVFEALGHPTRIRILQALSDNALGFSELKKETGIVSSGLLAFHLGKLTSLAQQNPEGSYALTDEGREALRIIEASRKQPEGRSGQRPAFNLPRQRAIMVALVAALIVLGSVAVYQQSRIDNLSKEVLPPTLSILGKQYHYETLPLTAVIAAGTITFDGVNFTATVFNTGSSSVTTSGALNQLLYRATAPCLTNHMCELAPDEFPDFVVSFGAGYNESLSPSQGVSQPIACSSSPTTQTANSSAGAQLSLVCTLLQSPSYTLWVSQGIWLSQHTHPQAGIRVDRQNATLTFYVSSS